MWKLIKFEISCHQNAGFGGFAAAKQRAHAGEQFGEGKWLDEIVVGPHLQAFDTVTDLVACR